MQKDASGLHESLGVNGRDVKAIKRKRKAGMLLRPMTAAFSAVGGAVLGFALTQSIDEPLSSYPYAVSLAAGMTAQAIGTDTRRGTYIILLVSALVGFAAGAIAGHLQSDSSIPTYPKYGVH